jgi:hypothetical protein
MIGGRDLALITAVVMVIVLVALLMQVLWG